MCKQKREENHSVPYFERNHIVQIQSLQDNNLIVRNQYRKGRTKKKPIELYSMGFRPIRSDSFPYKGERLPKELRLIKRTSNVDNRPGC